LTPPVPARLPIVSLPFNFRIPGDVTVTAPASAIASPPLNVNVPAITVVVPVYVFAPANVSSPVPAFVKFPLPLTTPFQFTALATVTVEFAVIAPVPPNVNEPLFVTSPSVTFAPIVNPFPNARAVVESLETTTLAVFNVNNPLPSPASLPIRNVPPVTVTPPVNVFAPLSTRGCAPAFVNETAPPPITPLNITALGVEIVVFEVNVPALLSVNTPVFVPSPSVTAPPTEYPFVNV
jgi:hypothetical protein